MKNLLWIAALLFSTLVLSQNQGQLSGNVRDVEINNEPLMFAQVEIQGTSWVTNTNLNGNFELSGIEPGSYILAISYAGYETEKMSIQVEENNRVHVDAELSAKTIDTGTLSEAAAVQAETAHDFTSDVPNSSLRGGALK